MVRWRCKSASGRWSAGQAGDLACNLVDVGAILDLGRHAADECGARLFRAEDGGEWSEPIAALRVPLRRGRLYRPAIRSAPHDTVRMLLRGAWRNRPNAVLRQNGRRHGVPLS